MIKRTVHLLAVWEEAAHAGGLHRLHCCEHQESSERCIFQKLGLHSRERHNCVFKREYLAGVEEQPCFCGSHEWRDSQVCYTWHRIYNSDGQKGICLQTCSWEKSWKIKAQSNHESWFPSHRNLLSFIHFKNKNTYLHCVVGWWYKHSSPLLQTGQNLHRSITFCFFKGEIPSSAMSTSIKSSVSRGQDVKGQKSVKATNCSCNTCVTLIQLSYSDESPHLLVTWLLPAACAGRWLSAPCWHGPLLLWPLKVVWRHPAPSHSRDCRAGLAPRLMSLWTWGCQYHLFLC